MLIDSLHLVQHTFKETPDITYGDNNFVAKFDRFYISYSYANNESFWYLDDVPFDTFPEVLEYGLMTERFTEDDYVHS